MFYNLNFKTTLVIQLYETFKMVGNTFKCIMTSQVQGISMYVGIFDFV